MEKINFNEQLQKIGDRIISETLLMLFDNGVKQDEMFNIEREDQENYAYHLSDKFDGYENQGLNENMIVSVKYEKCNDGLHAFSLIVGSLDEVTGNVEFEDIKNSDFWEIEARNLYYAVYDFFYGKK